MDSDEDIVKFYKDNLFTLFIAVEIWNIIYNVFLYIFKFEQVNISNVIADLLFLQQVHMSHMWYMPMILGIYIVIPFIAYYIKNFSLKVLVLPISIVFFSCFIIPNTNIIFSIFNKPANSMILDLSYCGGVYGIYLFLGYYINKNILKNISNLIIILGIIVFYLLTIIFQIYVSDYGVNYNVWYDFSGILFTTTFIFEIFHRTNITNSVFINSTRYISSISLGIFFIHRPIQMLLCKYIDFSNFHMCISVIIIWIVTVILSIVSVSILRKVSFIYKWIFIVK